jgi:hypothetical protein
MENFTTDWLSAPERAKAKNSSTEPSRLDVCPSKTVEGTVVVVVGRDEVGGEATEPEEHAAHTMAAARSTTWNCRFIAIKTCDVFGSRPVPQRLSYFSADGLDD